MDKIDAEKKARRKRIAEEIKSALQQSGYSHKEFAQKMGRVPSEVTRWLSGDQNFTSDLLAEMSVVLGEPISGVGDGISVIGTKNMVQGYRPLDTTGELNDCTSIFINGIDLPAGVAKSLSNKAKMEGKTLREYIIGVLSESARQRAVSAFDFAGIWSEDFPDIDEIRSARTANSFEEL